MKNKNSLIYAVVFMLLLTAVTTLVLALLDQSTRVRVEEQQLLEKHQAILYSAGIDVPPEEVDAVFAEKFVEVADAEETYEYYEGEKLVGYIVPYEGGLLWGSVTGYVGISRKEISSSVWMSYLILKHQGLEGVSQKSGIAANLEIWN